jgi:hypothetical protein
MSPSEKWRDQRSALPSNGRSSRFDEMRDLLQQFADTGFTLPQDATWLNGMTEYAEAAIACGDPRFARLLFELLEPFVEQFSSAGGVTAEGLVANCLGGLATILGRYEDAERFFTLASSFATRYDALLRRADRPPVGTDVGPAWAVDQRAAGARTLGPRPLGCPGTRLWRCRAPRGCDPSAIVLRGCSTSRNAPGVRIGRGVKEQVGVFTFDVQRDGPQSPQR